MNLKEVSLDIELGDGGECAMLLVQPTVPLEAVAGQGFQIADTSKRAASQETVKRYAITPELLFAKIMTMLTF
jgi:hypothetical protein